MPSDSGDAAALALATVESNIRSMVPAGRFAAVAYSGGADSAFLLAATLRALGADRVVAVTAVSPSLAASELTHANDFAASLGVRHLRVASGELNRPGYVENTSARCFHCKSDVIEVVFRAAAADVEVPVSQIVAMTGTNADDLAAAHRPGIAAARQLGAVTPLAGLTKADVRELSRHLGLATWDKPAQACLASRIAYGVPVSAETLFRVQRAEAALRVLFAARAIPVVNLRVRDLGQDRARVEVDLEQAAALANDCAVRDTVLQAGFGAMYVDPRGFRSGSMNEGHAGASQRRADTDFEPVPSAPDPTGSSPLPAQHHQPR